MKLNIISRVNEVNLVKTISSYIKVFDRNLKMLDLFHYCYGNNAVMVPVYLPCKICRSRLFFLVITVLF